MLKPKSQGYTNFYECCVLTKKVYLRSAHIDNEDAVFTILAAQEPDQCYRRLICDLSAGAIPDTDKLVTLFNGEVSPVSAKFEFTTAARIGKMVKSAESCEVRYSCPLNTNEIQELLK